MGWYGHDAICPNCKSENAECMFRNSCLESYYLVCPNCGLHLYASQRNWIVTNSYINKSVIGKDPQTLDLSETVDHEKNDNVIPKGTIL